MKSLSLYLDLNIFIKMIAVSNDLYDLLPLNDNYEIKDSQISANRIIIQAIQKFPVWTFIWSSWRLKLASNFQKVGPRINNGTGLVDTMFPKKLKYIPEDAAHSPRDISHFLFVSVRFIRETICNREPLFDGDILTIIGYMTL